MSKTYALVLSSIIIFICVVTLYPIIQSGYYDDDSFNSLIPAHTALDFNGSVLKHIGSNIESWMKNEGRFYPLSNYCVFVFSIFNFQVTSILQNITNHSRIVQRFPLWIFYQAAD